MPSASCAARFAAFAMLSAAGCTTTLVSDFGDGTDPLDLDGGADSPAPNGDGSPATGDAVSGDDGLPVAVDAACAAEGCRPVKLIGGETNVRDLTIDGQNVYFSRFATDGQVKELPLAGADSPMVLGDGIDGPTDLTLDGTGHVYWVTVGTGGVWQIFTAKVGVEKSAQSLLAPAPSGAAHGIAVDALHMFVGHVSIAGSATITSFASDGGAGTTLASGPGMVGKVRERGTDVVWTDTPNGRVYSNSKTAPNAPVGMAAGMNLPTEIVLLGDEAYWINQATVGTASIASAKIGVAQSNKAIATNLKKPTGIAAEGDQVFWTDASTGELSAMATDGTNPKLVAKDLGQPGPLAVSAACIVWWNAADGSIWKLAR